MSDDEFAANNSFHGLKQELEDAKNKLVTLNTNIKRIIGRNPKSKEYRISDKHFQDGKRTEIYQDFTITKKRGYDSSSVFNRLSSPTTYREEFPRLSSTVTRELPTRQEILAAQCTDSESRARNRRMFGSLLGTLHKFSQEESRLREKEERKAQIVKKVEEQEMQVREALRREREELFHNKKQKQIDIKKLELKISRINDFELWNASVTKTKQFIKTKTLPSIYYRPKVHTKHTTALLAECNQVLKKTIKERKELLQKDLNDIEENFKMEQMDNDVNNFDCEMNEVSAPSVIAVSDNEEGRSKRSSYPTLQSTITTV